MQRIKPIAVFYVAVIAVVTVLLLGGSLSAQNYYIPAAPGSDWCAQTMATDRSCGSAACTMILTNAVRSMSSCSVDITLGANHTLDVTEGGTYILGTHHIAPAGPGTAILCHNWNAGFEYTGAAYAYDVDTQPRSLMDSCYLTIGPSSLGGARWQHRTPHGNANNRADIFVASSAYTPGQVGGLLYTTGATDSNYANRISMQTLNVDIGLETSSLAGVENGANGNFLSVICNLHSICLDMLSGTDNTVTVLASGAHNLTGGTAIQCGGAGAGNYTCSTNKFYGMSEQGGTSTTISFLPGALVNYFDVMPNDVNEISDSSGVLSNRGSLGGLLYHPATFGSGSANKVTCYKSDGLSMGYCSSGIASDGSCACN